MRLCALGHLVVVQEVSCANKVLTRDVGDLVVHAVISGTKYKGKRIGEAASFLFLVIKKSSPSGREHSSKDTTIARLLEAAWTATGHPSPGHGHLPWSAQAESAGRRRWQA